MTLRNRIRRWWYWQKVARVDRQCRKRGHTDVPCWALSGALGDKCLHCGRILWTSDYGQRLDPPRYQEPTRLAEGNWR